MQNRCSNKNWKINAKIVPKSTNICPKIALETTCGHWFSDFWPFGAKAKNVIFWCRSKRSKTVKNRSKKRPRDANLAPRVRPGYRSWRPGPWGSLARDQIQDTKLQETGNKRQEMRKSYKKQETTRNKRRRDDLTRLWARDPANSLSNLN